jgi:hypothetical protein
MQVWCASAGAAAAGPVRAAAHAAHERHTHPPYSGAGAVCAMQILPSSILHRRSRISYQADNRGARCCCRSASFAFRFGVRQRERLLQGLSVPPHMLLMSATPIPRTLALVQFGGLVLSTIATMPPGRSRVATQVVIDSDAAREQVRRCYICSRSIVLFMSTACLAIAVGAFWWAGAEHDCKHE